MKLLIDMNLSPEWVAVLATEGIDAVHWLKIRASSAADRELMAWAKSNGHVVLTHDLDFGAILAATNADAPRCCPIALPGSGTFACEASEEIGKATSTGRPLGHVSFVEKLQELSGRHLKPQERGRPRRNEE